MTTTKLHIRWMIRMDMPDVLGIEDESFAYAWAEEDFLRCLRQRNCIGMVAEESDRVVGFMIYELHKGKLHLLNFAVHPERRGRGIGAAMVEKLFKKLKSQQRTKITTAIRESNLPGLAFFREHGLIATKTLRDWYEDGSGDDAIRMEYEIDDAK